MRVLLLRPAARERFGLGPFFRTEPLGLEYLAAALLRAGHQVEIADLRLTSRSPERLLARTRPDVVGISTIHTIDVPETLRLAEAVRRVRPSAFVMVGGHAAAASPQSFASSAVDAVCLGAGERSVPRLLEVLGRGGGPGEVPGFWVRGRDLMRATRPEQDDGIDPELAPARQLVDRFRHGYRCVHRAPVWALETARGCPFRCSFCAVGRSGHASRSTGAVCRDFESVGGDVFVVDDLFFYPRDSSRELAAELARRGVKKRWLLVQTRADTVARNAELLETWRPLAERFDLFFGFEAASDEELARLQKDATVNDAEAAVDVARRLGFGVTGNFVIDPDWRECDFERLWATVDRLRLDRVGFTVLTPLPGTPYYDEMRSRLREDDWERWDMHHVLWEPRLGRRRFYELVVQSWKRNVLASGHAPRRWLEWFRNIGPREAIALAGVLWQTQRLLDVDAYLDDTFPLSFPAAAAE